MSTNNRGRALQAAGPAHPRPDAVTARLFHSGDPFFFALDKVQVKYEMLRAHFGDGARSPRQRPRMATPAPSSTWWPPRSSTPG